ncbi:hypothetical protein EV122DRAFT_219033 [Schizophyllum commune]|nr:hypothetical protein K523DRAFT_255688 [Schizophyllum commune Tattone D]
MKAEYSKAPTLNLKNRCREAQDIMQQLSKHGIVERIWSQEQRDRRDLLEDVVDIITGWFSNIWRTIHEVKGNFRHVHNCLLWSLGTASKIVALSAQSSPAHNIPIVISINSGGGERIRLFEVSGLLDIRVAAFWLWRDLFMTMFAVNPKRARVMAPAMFSEIADTMGWSALQQILVSGLDEKCTGPEHEAKEQLALFRDALNSHLIEQFGACPSVELYRAAISTARSNIEARADLLSALREVDITSHDILVATLTIHIDADHPRGIVESLATHRHLFRVDDFSHLQSAVSTLARHELHLRDALAIVSQELTNIITSLRTMVLDTFIHINDLPHQDTLAAIFKLRLGSQTRRSTIRQWVLTAAGSVQHLGSSPIITGPPADHFFDAATSVDVMDLINPVLSCAADLAPYLSDSLGGWVSLASSIRGGEKRLQGAYSKILKEMAFFKAPDVVDAMILHISSYPNKAHVCAGLQQLSRFCKGHRTETGTKQRGWSKRESMKSDSASLRLWQ